MQGTVAALTPDDKIPGEYFEARDETGAGTATRYLWIVAASNAAGDGDLVADSEVRDITSDADALQAWGPNSRGYRAALRALQGGQGGISIKGSTYTISGGAQATAKVVVDGTWSTTGTWYGRLAGRPIGPIGIARTDDPEAVANAIADYVNADSAFAATGTVAAGDGTEFIVTFTDGSEGTAGNSLTLWQDKSKVPSGMTITLGGDVGGTVASDVGPWALANNDNLVVAFNAGGDQTFAVACTAAIITGTGATYAGVTAGHSVTIDINGTQYQAVFAGTENTQGLFHAVLASVLAGVALVTNSGGQTRITTSKKGSSITGAIVSGDSDVLASLGLSVASFTNAGPNNVADSSAITAAEWVTIMSALTNGTAEDDGGTLRLTSATTGSSGTVQVKSSSTSDDEMGFDNTAHAGGVGAGAALASGGVYFAGGSGTISLANLLTATFSDEFVTQVYDVTDVTNLGRVETQIDTKAGPLEGRLECAVVGLVGTLSASGSVAQSTLNASAFEVLWMEESEVPAEEFAARWAAIRHLAEFSTAPDAPNQRYDEVPLSWMVAQEAPSKRPSRSSIKSALNFGLTPIATIKGRPVLIRAVTTRTLTDLGAADDGTIDVAVDRTGKEYRRGLTATLRAHRAQYKFLDNDPAEGDEPEIEPNTTYPKRIRDVVKLFNQQKALDGWLAQVEAAENQPQVALNPNSATPRAVVYAPYVVRPLYHQTEGVVAKRKFQVATSA
jgi:hypothetical protein